MPGLANGSARSLRSFNPTVLYGQVSPDYNPIEYLWKKVKTKATHNRYFEEFVKPIQSVEESLAILASQPDEIMRLIGVYARHMTDPLAV
mgnify:CR=1 FL=1